MGINSYYTMTDNIIDPFLGIEPIDYRKMDLSSLPPWIDKATLHQSSKMNVSQAIPIAINPQIASLHGISSGRHGVLSQPKGPKIRPYLMPFMSLGPNYKDIFCIAGTSILLKKTDNNIYSSMGSFCPSLPSMFRTLTQDEKITLKEASVECGFQFSD